MRQAHRMASNATALVTMCRLLNESAYSQAQLIDKCGITTYTAVKWMRILRNQNLIFVERWQRNPTGHPTAYWRWGYKEPSAARPKPMTMAEYCERYRQKKRIKTGGAMAQIAVALEGK